MTNTETAAAGTTLTFPNQFAKLLAEAAIKRDAERQEAFHRLVDVSDPRRREHIDRLVMLDMDTHVFEIADGDEPPQYGVNDQGHIYAARALRVKPTVDY